MRDPDEDPIDDTLPIEPHATPPPAPPPPPATTGRFPAGTVLLDRYRIIERLGSGTMGEVYHAVDLRLDSDVALKFLHTELLQDPTARELMLNEIRTARRITHPNVCRVHDLGELEGRPFVTMEYVRGEDLATLIRRVGGLHGQKATQMARQICAGLQAAHDQGVLHRDLKPANILVDEHGNIRITDFGIAAAVDRAHESTAAGSPAYMAPELFTGGSASVATDVFALGLVLYELHTGKRLFEATSMTTLLKQHRQPIVPPTQVVPTIDRQTDATILACLHRDPMRRPASAVAVLAALPGGDPLAEALASGQTPSPALVAAAGETQHLGTQRAWALALAAVVVFVLIAIADPSTRLFTRTPTPLSRSVLVHHAHEHLDVLGCRECVTAEVHGFDLHLDAIDEIERGAPDFAGWSEQLEAERNPVLTFWYRASPQVDSLFATNIKARVDWNDPPHALPGMVRLEMDTRGRLRTFEHRPPEEGERIEPAVGGHAPPTETELFERAGLNLAEFQPVAPLLVPTAFADSRSAWQSKRIPELRVELARLQGWPVAFRVLDDGPRARGPIDASKRSFRFALRVLLIAVAGIMAWRALIHRRADTAGAAAIAGGVFALVTSFTVLTGDHGGAWTGVGMLATRGMSHGLAIAVELAIYYLALEPHVRRIWPQTLISWSRLLGGRLRDPLVAGSLLVGVLAGSVAALMWRMILLIPRMNGEPELAPFVGRDPNLEILTGIGPALGVMFEIIIDVTRESMMMFVVLVVLRKILRRPVVAAIATTVLFSLLWGRDYPGTATSQVVAWTVTIATTALVVFSAIRFGLLALVAGSVVFGLFWTFPVRPSVDVWYSTVTMVPTVGTVGTLAFAVWCIARTRRR